MPLKSLDQLPISFPAADSAPPSFDMSMPAAMPKRQLRRDRNPFPPRVHISGPGATGNEEIPALTSRAAIFVRVLPKKHADETRCHPSSSQRCVDRSTE